MVEMELNELFFFDDGWMAEMDRACVSDDGFDW